MSLELSASSLKYSVLGIALCLAGCSGTRQSYPVDRTLPYDQYVYNYKNPYTVEEIARVNSYLEELVSASRLQDSLEIYFIPVEGSANRLVFIRKHSNYELAPKTRDEINRKLEGFLNTLLEQRGKDQPAGQLRGAN